ncbi:3'-5' exonuclease [Dictyocaulus viviparus]|uniref:3'-5' exonuclease n=1 Tax=Dictyocaulus viviparus TaxID=29172 RepID=A0A0D8Y2Z1_DICVI|nr:3'-5' exonuclease [Dictyocaulus viviparus]
MGGVMERIPSDENTLSTSTADEVPKKLSKAEKKALYKPSYAEPHDTRRKDVFMNEKDEDLKYELMSSILYSIYEMDDNPYIAMLQLHKICPDYSSNKAKSIAGHTVSSFRSWLLKQADAVNIFEKCVTKELQIEAFRIATAKQTTHLKLFKEIFWLDKSELLPMIKEEINSIIERHMFKEAMDVVEEFGLSHDYDLTAFVIPCLLQDKLSSVVKYMRNDRQIQKDFISYLDSFVGLTVDEVVARLKSFKDSEIMTIQYDRFAGKTIEKMIYKLATELALPIETIAPNLFRARKEGELRFKVQSRFVTQELGDDAYFGHGALSEGDERLKMYFINFLVGQRHYEDAVRWVVYFKICESRLPCRLLDYIRNTPNALYNAKLNIKRLERRAEDVGNEIVELMPGYPIVTVTTWSQLRALIEKFENETHIGIDSEWKPQYITPSESAALLQIAIADGVYLVDFCSLEHELIENQWDFFLRSLLCNSSLKIGFDLTNDLRALFASPSTYPLRSILDNISNVVCLKLLAKNLLEVDRNLFDINGLVGYSSANDEDELHEIDSYFHFKLSDLSERLLGVKLDKSEQCSNWAIRPLRIDQKRYAAMDAYIVIALFSKLKTTAESHHIDFHAVVQSSNVSNKRKDKIKLKKDKMKFEDMTWAEICEKLSDVLCGNRKATELQCIVDSMLFGLGKHMRHDLKSKAFDSERIILTCGKAFNELKRLFPTRVLCIPNVCAMNPIEQLRFVFTKYAVTFSGLDIFSRCVECNNSCMVKAPSIVIQALFDSVVTCRSEFHDEAFDVVEWSERLSSVDPEQYDGIGCRLIFCGDNGIVVRCCGGTIDIITNIVTHDDFEDGVEVIVKRVPEHVVSRPRTIFYICASCGKVYWENDS